MQRPKLEHFRFKRFEAQHGLNSFKIGTDAVILGAFAGQNKRPKKILDIGTGSGIIALMLAQRFSDANITAIEIDKGAALIASQNFKKSPFSNSMNIVHEDLKKFNPEVYYDLITCNPPFFSNSLKPKKETDIRSKHDDFLKLEDILVFANKYLNEDGQLCIILPKSSFETILTLETSLIINHVLNIRANPNKDAHRFVLSLAKQRSEIDFSDELVIEKGQRHDYHEDYLHLCKDFYLKF